MDALQRSNDNEQYGRLEAIRVYGIPENVCDLFVTFFRTSLVSNIVLNHINKIHRLGAPSNVLPKPQPIILRFFAHGHKRDCIHNRKKLKDKGIVIVEDLTRINHHALDRARNHELVTSAWSVEGKL